MPTKIEWAQESWNPITGCTPISEGCTNCYARRMAKRLRGRCGYPADDPFRVTLHPDRLEQPLHWRKSRRIFVCSMGDLFHEDVPAHFIYKVFEVMRNCPHHVFILCTKRAKRMKKITDDVYFHLQRNYHNSRRSIFPLPNVIKMVTAENQAMADLRISWLSQMQAATRGVSLEPMLGPVDLSKWLMPKKDCQAYGENPTLQQKEQGIINCFRPENVTGNCETWGCVFGKQNEIDWAIVGGESGPGARPAHPGWFRKVRDDCVAAGIPFFFKQHGEYVEHANEEQIKHWNGNSVATCEGGNILLLKVGKKAAGRELDGRVYSEFPVAKNDENQLPGRM